MKTIINLTVILLLFLFGSHLLGDNPPVEKAITEANEILAIYREDWRFLGAPSQKRIALILAVWEDGYIVWSDDRLYGGEPYHAAKIDPKRLESFFSTFEQRGAFDQKNYDSAPLMLDSQQTAIFMKYVKKKIIIRSCHELLESGGKNVIDHGSGAKVLDGENLYDALRSQSSDNLFFRMIWNEIRARSAELVPSADKPVKGELKMHGGIMRWVEN